MQTESLRVRKLEVADAHAMAHYVEKNQLFHAPWEPPRPKSYLQADYWLRKIAMLHQQRKKIAVGIFKSDTGNLIGQIWVNNIERGPSQSCWIAYSLDHAFTGQGFMTEALEVLLDFLFTELSLHRVNAAYMPSNIHSGMLLKRLGFVKEGYAKNYLFINGAWRDHVLTSLICPQPSPPPAPSEIPVEDPEEYV